MSCSPSETEVIVPAADHWQFKALLPVIAPFLRGVFYRHYVVRSLELNAITPLGNLYRFKNAKAGTRYPRPEVSPTQDTAAANGSDEDPMLYTDTTVIDTADAGQYASRFSFTPAREEASRTIRDFVPELRRIHAAAEPLPLDTGDHCQLAQKDSVAYAIATGNAAFLAALTYYFASDPFLAAFQTGNAAEQIVPRPHLDFLRFLNELNTGGLKAQSKLSNGSVDDWPYVDQMASVLIITVVLGLAGLGHLTALREYLALLRSHHCHHHRPSAAGTQRYSVLADTRLRPIILIAAAQADQPAVSAAYVAEMTYLELCQVVTSLQRLGWDDACQRVPQLLGKPWELQRSQYFLNDRLVYFYRDYQLSYLHYRPM
ncbi:hypothetical protein IWQ60_000565 [Tieghemiomyces parasiticus]|uniref:Uncharacterized protein n=1 Tax=Tieghemiomyces parasiticus TaxID=78921 RepID=A0A9W8AIN0_9FUNG|nr:hypothetical protein IWQ60_000565 [Tieghemiomyces parasiticus]